MLHVSYPGHGLHWEVRGALLTESYRTGCSTCFRPHGAITTFAYHQPQTPFLSGMQLNERVIIATGLPRSKYNGRDL